jgi:hypothetical protein
MEAFLLSHVVATGPPAVGLVAHPQGDFAFGLRHLPVVDVAADFATGMRAGVPRPASGHFGTGQSWHPQPYVGRGDFAVGLSKRPRVSSVVADGPRGRDAVRVGQTEATA